MVRRHLIEPLLGLEDSPEKLARGVTLGMFVALTPTVGGQMLISLALAVPCRANKVAAMAMVWITNPVTVVPYYYASYRLGLLLLGREGMDFSHFKALLPGPEQGIWQSLKDMFVSFGWPLWVGACVIAVVATLITYPWSLIWFRRRAARKLAASP